MAPRANLVGYNFLKNSTISNGVDALTRGSPDVHISSNSWGALDNTGLLNELELAFKTAINNGLSNGRHGLGTIYVFAGGNGGDITYNGILDNSNYDGQASYRGVIAVAAVDNLGIRAAYSEEGANILISAPAGRGCSSDAITTTDLTGTAGYNVNGLYYFSDGSSTLDYTNDDYTKCMTGTSAATPMVSGAVA